MRTVNALTKLERAGFYIVPVRDSAGRFVAAKLSSPYQIEFLTQKGEVALIRVRRIRDHGDSMTDHTAGVLASSITKAIALAD
jgi:hypothetical protein